MKYGIEYNKGCLSIFTSLGLYRIDSFPSLKISRRDAYTEGEWIEIESIEFLPNSGFIGIFVILEECVWLKDDSPHRLFINEKADMHLPKEIFVLPIVHDTTANEGITNAQAGIPIEVWYRSNRLFVIEECERFLNTIPSVYLQALNGMGLTKDNHPFKLLKAFHSNLRFFQLFQANKGLAFYYFYLGIFNNLSNEQFYIDLLSKKQKEIGRILGFQLNEISILKKIDSELLQPKIIREVISFARNRKYTKVFTYLTKIHRTTYQLLYYLKQNDSTVKISIPFLDDVHENLDYELKFLPIVNENYEITHTSFRIPQAFALLYHLSKKYPDLKINAVYEIEDVIYDLLELKREKEILQSGIILASNPPFPGNQYVEPVLTEKDLYLEGVEQENCCYTFKDQIMEGEYYFYRVNFPERATLAIEKEGRVWIFSELSAKGNTPTNEITWTFVKTWLVENGIHY